MTDRALRNTACWTGCGSTPYLVGPGSYNHTSTFTSEKPSFIGFSSSSSRMPRDRVPKKMQKAQLQTSSVVFRRGEEKNIQVEGPSVALHAPICTKKIKGTSTFMSNISRFAPVERGSVFLPSSVREVPGPGTYHTSRTQRDIPSSRKGRKQRKNKKSLRIPRKREPVQSIPIPHEILESNLTCNQEDNSMDAVPRCDDSNTEGDRSKICIGVPEFRNIGPTSYDPSFNLVRESIKNVDFHVSKSERNLFNISIPKSLKGEIYSAYRYDSSGNHKNRRRPKTSWRSHCAGGRIHEGVIIGPTKTPQRHMKSRSQLSSAFASRVPFATAHIPYKAKRMIPGPGQFCISTDDLRSSSNTKKEKVNKVISVRKSSAKTLRPKSSFVPSAVAGEGGRESSLQRDIRCPFHNPTSMYTPGPGSYIGANRPMNDLKDWKLRKSAKERGVGFDSTRDRFESSARSRNLPGPGKYDTKHMTIEDLAHRSLRRASTSHVRFGTRSFKFQDGIFPSEKSVDKRRFPVPGPGKYASQSMSQIHRRGASDLIRMKQSAVFESGSKRFERTHCVSHETPSQIENRPLTKRQAIKNCAQPFAKQPGRFDHMKEGQIFYGATHSRTAIPGPGAYKPTKPMRMSLFSNSRRVHVTDGLAFGSNRWRDKSEDDRELRKHVGPGTYNTMSTSSVVKRTYNVTLMPKKSTHSRKLEKVTKKRSRILAIFFAGNYSKRKKPLKQWAHGDTTSTY